ncbi:YkvA family protein [Nostoc sp. NIES-3756]|uniref:YkvA family protein n=1 Tax=Nostoc sp. NIES-3756 TaxID=1751286 RepID=UPI000836F0F2|nr:YkvA family protein [Nostoc sp. NIES-3756]
MTSLERLKQQAKRLKTELYALYLAYKDTRVPWYARIFTACIIAYAFSPIDLIPDFIPVFGYLDDLILVPLGIKLALKMIPQDVMEECRLKAQSQIQRNKPNNWIATGIIAIIWFLFALLAIRVIFMFLINKKN